MRLHSTNMWIKDGKNRLGPWNDPLPGPFTNMVRIRTILRRMDREAQFASLGKALRAAFAEMENEPLPDRLRELLERLKEDRQVLLPPTNH